MAASSQTELDKYFRNEMSPRERQRFEQRLQTDDELRAAWLVRRDLHDVLHPDQQVSSSAGRTATPQTLTGYPWWFRRKWRLVGHNRWLFLLLALGIGLSALLVFAWLA